MALLNSLLPSFARQSAQCDSTAAAVRPVYDVREQDEVWALTVRLPGVAKADLTITDEEGILTIRGERTSKPLADRTTLYRESQDYPFSLRLQHDDGIDVDKAQAELKDGVLTLKLPKTEARKPRKIAVA
jgi:HSP20 family protein